MKKLILALSIALFSSLSFAQNKPTFTYDVSGSSGTYNDRSYTEIHLGLNWNMTDWFNWRNSVFTQFGSDLNTVWGLDTTGLFRAEFYTQGRDLGVEFFAGPGLRLANEKSSAALGTAGLTLALGGLRIGGGATYLNYFETRQDKLDQELPKDEVQYFITLSGGGSF